MIPSYSTLSALRRGDLAGARELSLAGCGLTELPDELYGLADTLEVLDLSGNRLTGLPHEFDRLRHLRVLFASGNSLEALPPVLGGLPELSQLGFRRTGLRTLPAESLPSKVRWLTLTDNALSSLPEELGRRPSLRKLMLAGNTLTALPESLADADQLELLRLAANRLETLPPWLADLPALAWLAWAGNPFEAEMRSQPARMMDWSDFQVGAVLGEGASGRVHESVWSPPGETPRRVAVKIFKGAITSDGLPAHEMSACLAAGEHPGLIGAVGRVAGLPDGAAALVMPLLPQAWRALADPPSRESCSRDVYNPELRLDVDVALEIASSVAAGAAHLHSRGLMHGDLYAHNILYDGGTGRAVLSDFGASSRLPASGAADLWTRLETLAFGHLLGELLDRCDVAPDQLRGLQATCVGSRSCDRPSLPEVADVLGRDRPF